MPLRIADYTLGRRIAMVNALATLCLVATLLLMQAWISTMSHADTRDYLWSRIDIPVEVQSLWDGMGVDMGYHVHGVAALSPDWSPCMGFLVARLWAVGLVILAAFRRNTVMFFVMLALLALPGEAFGTNDHEMGPTGAVVATGIVVIQASLARRFRLAVMAGIAALVVIALPAAFDGRVHAPEGMANQVFDERSKGWRTDTDAVERISAAMAAATPDQRPAADYVLAQMAYLRQDWPAARVLALRLRPDRFSQGPYTAKRVFVLCAFAEGRTAFVSQQVHHILDIAYLLALLSTVACAVVARGMHRRSRRIEEMTQRLAPLRRLGALA